MPDPMVIGVGEFVATNNLVFRVRLSTPLRARLRLAVWLLRLAAWLAGAATEIQQEHRPRE